MVSLLFSHSISCPYRITQALKLKLWPFHMTSTTVTLVQVTIPWVPWTAAISPNCVPASTLAHLRVHCLQGSPKIFQHPVVTLWKAREYLEKMDWNWRYWCGLMFSKMCKYFNMYVSTCRYNIDTHMHTCTFPSSVCWKNLGAMTLPAAKLMQPPDLDFWHHLH